MLFWEMIKISPSGIRILGFSFDDPRRLRLITPDRLYQPRKPVACAQYSPPQRLAAGVMLGSTCAVATGYALRSAFYEVHSASAPVLLGSALLLFVPALWAIVLPARRVAHQDLVQTLRRE